VTLDDIFAEHGLERCKLLKIDCEGSEHEILLSTGVLPRVEHLAGEFHINGRLRAQGHSIERLRAHCARFVPEARTHCVSVEMGE
jgi:hypothetical protein